MSLSSDIRDAIDGGSDSTRWLGTTLTEWAARAEELEQALDRLADLVTYASTEKLHIDAAHPALVHAVAVLEAKS